MKNFKTTLAGVLTGLGVGADAIINAIQSGTFTDKTGIQLVIAIGLVLLGAYSKDHDVTGGVKANTPNSAPVVDETSKVSQ